MTKHTPQSPMDTMSADQDQEMMALRNSELSEALAALGLIHRAKIGRMALAQDSATRGLCDCWVKDRPAEHQFEIRRGAHGLDCPFYRQSLDPVDAQYDAEMRQHFTA